MYGDDTWLKLFPDFFHRADGTTSFFVSDFTEVDKNVTRHVPDELTQKDWSVMILHFLGLDHIGHKSGPRSINMASKQKEMDKVIEEIYDAMEHSSHLDTTLLVLCGDHGMNEAGNHGGSSSGEVTTALAFISPKFKEVFEGLESPMPPSPDYSFYPKVEQSDIAPTLASLLDFPIPLNNLGVIIPKLLDLWSQDMDRVDLLYANAHQVAEIANATYSEAFKKFSSLQQCAQATSDAALLSCAWLEAHQTVVSTKNGEESAVEAVASLLRFLENAQLRLSGTASNYDLVKMSGGIILAVVSVILAILSTPNDTFKTLFSIFGFTSTVLCHSLTMFASSYVEEEHQFWYWALSGWLMYLSIKQQRLIPWNTSLQVRRLLFPLVSLFFGIIRHLISTGQKYAALPSISSALFPAESWLLWSSTILTYALTSRRLTRRASTWGESGSRQLSLLPLPVCIAAFAFKVAFTHADSPELLKDFTLLSPLVALTSRYSLLGQARIVFLGLAHMLACALYYEAPWSKQRKDAHSDQSFIHTFHDLLNLFLLTQSRVTNIPVFLMFSIQLSAICAGPDLFSDKAEIALTSLLLQQSSFFALGGTNAISSVDLSNAYNGISGYNVLLVAILTFVSNWAGPTWWATGTALLLSERDRRTRRDGGLSPPITSSAASSEKLATGGDTTNTKALDGQDLRDAFFAQFALLTVFTTTSTLGVMLACTVLREHLFIWTVFSPKYLYIGAWAFGHHFIVNGVLIWGLLGTLSRK